MQLRPGTSLTAVIETLKAIDQDAGNAANRTVDRFGNDRLGYLRFVDSSVRRLRSLFADDELITQFYSPEYRQLVVAQPVNAEALLMNSAIDNARSLVKARIDELSALLPIATRVGDVALVPDTNVFLHCEPFDQLDWCADVGAKSVRLVLTMPVIDEIDVKKYAKAEKISERATKSS